MAIPDVSPGTERPVGLDRKDSDVSTSSSTGELFEMDPLRRSSATTVDTEHTPISPSADLQFSHRPVIVRGSASDESRSQAFLPVGLDRHQDEVDPGSKGVVSQGKEMVENGIESLAAKWKSFGFAGGKSSKAVGPDQDHLVPGSSTGRNPSPNRHQRITLPHLSNRPRIPSAELQHHPHHPYPGYYHESSDLTPRAEHPPNYSPKSMAETVTSPTNRRETRASADQDEDETNPSAASSRNGTIKRKRDTTVRQSLLLNRGDHSTGKAQESSDRKSSGYFPDVDELKRKAKQQRNAEKAKRKSDALARRARASALATFATSPRASSPFTSPTEQRSLSWQTRDGSEIESPSDSENSGTDEMDTPWPSSARHGDTPLGLEHEIAKSSRASLLKERMNSMGSIEEKHSGSPFGSRRNSIDRRSSLEILTDEDEVLQAGTGCAISNPLAPPPGYPLYSPQIGSDTSDKPWPRTSSYAGSSANNSPPSVARSHSSSQALPVKKSEHTPYGQYFGFLPAGSQPTSQGSSASGSGPESDLQKRLYSRFETSSKGLAIDAPSPVSGSLGISPRSGPSPSDSPRINNDSDGQGSSPFEGKITIDTSPDRYVILVGEMAGFSLENITIAVKSINRSSSSSSSAPRAGLVHSQSSDASSIHSHSSTRSSVSFHGLDKRNIPRAASPDVLVEGKVLHLIADRWEDSGKPDVARVTQARALTFCSVTFEAHFERRITFGKDADFSNGVKAKFDGTKLVIQGELPLANTSTVQCQHFNGL